MQLAGLDCSLNDFELGEYQGIRRIYYRVSKEKPLVHHCINQALALLPPGGELVLSGEKGDGIKTYYDKARALVGAEKSLKKLKGNAFLGRIVKQSEPSGLLDDSDYCSLRPITDSPAPGLFSKPGVYGWQKIDRGSALLIEALQALKPDPERVQTLLDLGCGYGYLSVLAHQLLPQTRIVATDNNAAAIAACQQNFAEHAIKGEVVAADCAQGIEQSFDCVLCNPPFHKGFDVHGDLTRLFLERAAERLKPGGRALFVVNQFIALEQKAEGLFARSERVLEGQGFKVLLLHGH
nr:methyltransferase [Litorivivens lipolytica]